MHKKLTIPVALCFLFLSQVACKKDCKPRSLASEIEPIEAYAAANGINATAHSSGVYYEIIDPGSGASPTINSRVVITYTGKLLNGEIFDQQLTPNNTADNGPWPLSSLIQGWQYGLPLIKKGGHIKLIVPSALAYGCEQYVSIPGNSILFFDIQLIDVQ